MWVCQCVRALQRWSALIALGGGGGVMSRWLCHCVIPGRPHAEHCLFIHLISPFNWFFVAPCDNEPSRIPQRSLTINSEVADAALRHVLWVRSWQGSHHSCLTRPQYIWHVPSNTDPPLYRISATDVRRKDLHWFHSISLLSLLSLWRVSQLSFFADIHVYCLRCVCTCRWADECGGVLP